MSRRRTERLVNLVICLLSTRRYLTAAQIAAMVPGYEHDARDPREHEAFQRKFERDKAELRELGVPLETGTTSAFDTEAGYRIARRQYALPELHLDADEAAAVGVAAQLWQHAGLSAAASSGLAKLRAAGIDVDVNATLGIQPVVSVDPAFGAVSAAVQARQAIGFRYRAPQADAVAARRLQPWGVASWRGRWYVVGHDLDRAAPRCFRLSRIVGSVRRIGEPDAYTPPAVDLIRYVATSAGPAPRQHEAVVALRPGRAAGVRRRAQQVLTGGDGERVILRFDDAERLADWLASYGADVQVLEPAGLRGLVIRRLRDLVAAHSDSAAAVPGGDEAASPGGEAVAVGEVPG